MERVSGPFSSATTALGASGVALMAALASSSALAADRRPNVVFILADNVGYGDLGPYGGGELRCQDQ